MPSRKNLNLRLEDPVHLDRRETPVRDASGIAGNRDATGADEFFDGEGLEPFGRGIGQSG